MASSWDVEGESGGGGGAPSPRAAGPTMLPSSSASQEFNGLSFGLVAAATLFMLFGAFIAIDLVRNLYEFQGDGPGSGIVKSLAGIVGGG